jgi:membrane protease YdiL (CAAX protease family)
LFLDNSGFDTAPKQEVLNDVANAGWRDRIFMYLAVCVVTPVVEEVLFRRIIFGKLATVAPPVVAVIITSLIFAIVHFFIKGLPALFVMGLAFQLIYLMRKNLFSAILLHALVNSIAFFANAFPSLE